MRKYKYIAVNVEKKKFVGSFIAENEDHLRGQLAQQNLYLISCKPIRSETPNRFFSLTGKVGKKELAAFCRQFAIMLNSGMSVLESLSQLEQQRFSGYFKKLLFIIYDDVKVGSLLSKAMEKHKKVFPEFFRSMIYVGEASGNLEGVLFSLADYYDNEVALSKKIKNSLAYPVVLGILLIAIVGIMLLFVVPQFREALSKMNVTEDKYGPLTRALFDTSYWLINNGLILLLVLLGVAVILFILLKTEKGKETADMILYKMPWIKHLHINMVASKFAKSLGLLLASGMNMSDALEIVQNLLGNKYAEKKFKSMVSDVRQGASLSFAMEQYKIFPELMIQMISTGESTGAIEEVLTKSMKIFDSQIESALAAVTGLIQPIMLTLLGVVIGLMFIAVYSPMLSIMNMTYNF